MKKFTKILSIFLAVLMLAATISLVSSATTIANSGTCGENLTWTFDSEGTLTISGTGDMYDYYYDDTPWFSIRLSIISVVISEGVTNIGDYAFAYCEKLTNISIPNSVTNIGDYAFFVCRKLTSINIPASITHVDYSAFVACYQLERITVDINNKDYSNDENGVLFNKDKTKLIKYPIGKNNTTYTVPESVLSIEESAFADCKNLSSIIFSHGLTNIDYHAFSSCDNLTNVILPESVENIGPEAFAYCKSLTSFTIPENVSYIGYGVFHCCYGLENIIVNTNNKNFSSDEYGVLFDENKTEIIQYPIGNTRTTYTVPEGVTTIGSYAFRNCDSLVNINLSEGIKTINHDAFWNSAYYANPENWTDGVFYIGAYLVSAKENLSGECVVKEGTKYIVKNAFLSCSNVTSIKLPEGITSIARDAFSSTAYYKNSENWENGVLYIDDYLIEADRKLSGEYIVKEGTTLIADSAFASCYYVTDIYLPESVTNIGENAFYSCTSLASMNLPEGITNIGPSTFQACYNLENINIPEGVTSIGEWAFSSCRNLTSISIPNSITNINISAFRYCYKLADVYFYGTQEQWNKINIEAYNEDLTEATIHFIYHEHSYNPILTAPTCTEKGYTTYACECGDTYEADYVDANGHSYASAITTPATHLAEGVETFTCECGDTYTETLAKIPHSYNKVVTEPTCTTQGFTTYTCECGDTYVGDYVGTKTHNYSSSITRPATHLSEGIKTYTCRACGDSYTETIVKIKEHSYVVSDIVAPTCEKEGYTVYVCECGYSYDGDKISATGHDYEGDNCEICGESKTENCSCNCHRSGLMSIIWKILRIFYKIFRINPVCACGIAHY